MNSPRPPVSLLFDNGSLRAESTRSLRRVAASLATRLGREVRAASWLHSNRVPATELDGVPAALLGGALRELLAESPSAAVDLHPLFFGPNAVLTEHLPALLGELRASYPFARFRLAPCLVDPGQPADCRIARMLAAQVRSAAGAVGWKRPKALLVDHGSPVREVTAVRNHLGAQLRLELGDDVVAVGVASMERRPGVEFAFNEPLLAAALRTPPFDRGSARAAIPLPRPARRPGGRHRDHCAGG